MTFLKINQIHICTVGFIKNIFLICERNLVWPYNHVNKLVIFNRYSPILNSEQRMAAPTNTYQLLVLK